MNESPAESKCLAAQLKFVRKGWFDVEIWRLVMKPREQQQREHLHKEAIHSMTA